MYSRGYYTESKERISIPDGYDGTSLIESNDLYTGGDITDTAPMPESIPEAPKREVKRSPQGIHNMPEGEECEDTVSTGKVDTPPHKSILGSGFDLLRGILPKSLSVGRWDGGLELEDLLIIGIALFLFFSKSGDKELALMLAFIVLIK